MSEHAHNEAFGSGFTVRISSSILLLNGFVTNALIKPRILICMYYYVSVINNSLLM